HDMQVPEEGKRPDDHIASELAFLELLCAEQATALRDGTGDGETGDTADNMGTERAEADAATATQQVEVIRNFLSDHLLVFAPLYCKNLQTRAREPFYRQIAALTEALLAKMASAYNARPSVIISEADFLL
ncbi:MAG TPA: hypothetical protein DEB24_04605, partial [Coriobacteriia bacterium]|nr:hypothetical protein [Coriobacteriia bacterium]